MQSIFRPHALRYWHSRFQTPLRLLPVGRLGYRTPQNHRPLPNPRAQVRLRRAAVDLFRMKNYLQFVLQQRRLPGVINFNAHCNVS